MSERRFILVSGMSGAGKTTALHALEDAGFYCVDNLPAGFLAEFARFISEGDLPHYRQVAVGIDARKGFVATKGWATETTVQATDLARSFEDAGVAAIIYTDIDRDGAMQGPNIEATEALARAVSIPVIASGGVSRMEDLIALRDTGIIAGAISGRALYDGAIDLSAAIAALRG